MTNLTTVAAHSLFSDTDLSERSLASTLEQAMSPSIDSADIYLQSCQEESWLLENGIVKEGQFDVDHGFGLRVLSGEKVGFAFANDFNMGALGRAAHAAKRIARSGQGGRLPVLSSSPLRPLYPQDNPLNSLKETEKVDLLLRLDAMARQKDPRVKEVFLSLSASYDVVLMIRNDGQIIGDIRPLVSLMLRVIVEQKGRREQGMGGGGARSDYRVFFEQNTAESYVDKAVAQALTNLEAVPAPAGTMPVVLGPGWPAVLLHEAVGHGLEGDFNRKGSSAFSGRIGEQVASPLCTIVDDGTFPGRRGSLTVDDEGTPTQKTVLIENGILKTYMQDRHNAKLMGTRSTGNGRRESYADTPLPRMTNTYMLAGETDPNEIIASVERGLYVKDMSGGQVDITSGKFVFSTSEAYYIEQGRISHPVKGATLIGNGPDILKRVSLLGNDLMLDSGLGNCGKAGQTVPVGVGQPTVKIDAMTVGGSS